MILHIITHYANLATLRKTFFFLGDNLRTRQQEHMQETFIFIHLCFMGIFSPYHPVVCPRRWRGRSYIHSMWISWSWSMFLYETRGRITPKRKNGTTMFFFIEVVSASRLEFERVLRFIFEIFDMGLNGGRKQMFINYFGSCSWTLAWHYRRLPSSLGIYRVFLGNIQKIT